MARQKSEVDGLPLGVPLEADAMAGIASDLASKIIVGSPTSSVALVYYLVLNDGNQAQSMSEPTAIFSMALSPI